MSFLLSGHFWLILSAAAGVTWIGMLTGLLMHRRHSRDAVAARTYHAPRVLRVTTIVLFIVAVVALIMSAIVAFIMYGKKPVTMKAQVVSPTTVAEDGTRYVELTWPTGTWICEDSDECSGLQVGQRVYFTAQTDDEGEWRYWDLRQAPTLQ